MTQRWQTYRRDTEWLLCSDKDHPSGGWVFVGWCEASREAALTEFFDRILVCSGRVRSVRFVGDLVMVQCDKESE